MEVRVVQDEASLSDVGYLFPVASASYHLIRVGGASASLMIWGRWWGRARLPLGRLRNYVCTCICGRICTLSLTATICTDHWLEACFSRRMASAVLQT